MRLGEVLATVYCFGDGAAATVVIDGVPPGFYREGERKEWRRRPELGKKKRISHRGPPCVDSFGILDLQGLMKLVAKWLSLSRTVEAGRRAKAKQRRPERDGVPI